MAGDSLKGSGDNASMNECRKASKQKLEKWLNKSMRIKMTDGRTLVDSEPKEDPRILGLAMVPGKHVVSIEIDDMSATEEEALKHATRNNVSETSSRLENDTPVSERGVGLDIGAQVL